MDERAKRQDGQENDWMRWDQKLKHAAGQPAWRTHSDPDTTPYILHIHHTTYEHILYTTPPPTAAPQPQSLHSVSTHPTTTTANSLFLSAFGFSRPARECFRLLSSLIFRASIISLFSFVALWMLCGTCLLSLTSLTPFSRAYLSTNFCRYSIA